MEGSLVLDVGADAETAVTRMSLPAALARGPEPWDRVGGAGASPFMSWAWHRAWARSAPAAERDACAVFVSPHAVLPLRLDRVRFRRAWVRALVWAIGDTGCPDGLDVPASAETDWGAFAAALDALPWQVVILSNLAQTAPNADRLVTALGERGHTVRRNPLWCCPWLELPSSWDAYLATLSANRRQILRRKARALVRDRAARLVEYDADRLDEGWGHLLRLHAQRWDGPGGNGGGTPGADWNGRTVSGA